MFRNGFSQVCTKMSYHRETFIWAYINVFLKKIQSWLKESSKTSNKYSHCAPGQRLKAVDKAHARVSVGKHLSLAGISASSHVWDIQ